MPHLIANSFSLKAARYDGLATIQRICAEKLVSLLPSEFHERKSLWLDLGCGTGFVEEYIRKNGYIKPQVCGLDIAFHSVQILTQKRIENVLPVCADIDSMPFPAPLFEIIFSSSTLQWVKDLSVCIKRCSQLTKTHGLLLIAVPVEPTLQDLHRLQRAYNLSVPVTYQSKENIIAICQNAGYSVHGTEENHLTTWFDSAASLIKQLSSIGATATVGRRLSRAQLQQFCREFEERHSTSTGIPAHYSILYLIASKL